MGRPFSVHVGGEDWRREAEQWVIEKVEDTGRTITGTIEQARIRPWSTQLTIPTDEGLLWFKANCPAMNFEPRLQVVLASLLPDSVDAPVAIEADRGWMLMADRGVTLGDNKPTIEDWQRVLTQAAAMQRSLADESERILGTGIPDCSPTTVVDRFDRFVEIFAELPESHPSYVPPTLRDQLLAVRPALVDAVTLLDESALPSTWQHGDLHPHNVFAVGGGLRLFDFGDSQWAHAVELLSVPYGWITNLTSLRWEDARDAYCDVWGIAAADLEPLWQATALTHPVNRTLLWWRALDQASAAEWSEWGDGPLHHLTRVLDQ